jgi:hypothetical protein
MFGGYSSAAVDGAGRVGIAFVDDSGLIDKATFATTDSSGSWVTESVSQLGWFNDYLALAFDSGNTAWMAYCDGQFPPSILISKRLGRNSWQPPVTLSAIGSATGPAIAIAPDNTVYVSFVDSTSGSLKVAHSAGGSGWVTDTVDGSLSSQADGYTSLAIDPQGRPAVAYFADSSAGTIGLKYAVKVGGVWQKETVLPIPSSGDHYCSLAVASDGTPWIAYLDPSSFNLACARKVSGVWTHETVDTGALTGYRPSIRLDAGGNPMIAYSDRNQGFIQYAWAVVPRSIQDIKKLPDGITVRCEGLVSSTEASPSSSDFSDRHYLQSADRSEGIMVYYGAGPDLIARGTYVTVTGVMGRINGERAILSPAINSGQIIGEPRPIGMTNVSLGGGSSNYVAGSPSTGQKGITGASGLNNMGLLVKIWGSVVETDSSVPPTWFKVDDGSRSARVKCLLPTGVSAPSGFVKLTGISSCEDDESGNLSRVLRLRAAGDIGF